MLSDPPPAIEYKGRGLLSPSEAVQYDPEPPAAIVAEPIADVVTAFGAPSPPVPDVIAPAPAEDPEPVEPIVLVPSAPKPPAPAPRRKHHR